MAANDRVTQIARQFEQSILSGALTPGEQLPSERDLSAQLGVSRGVVREAIGRLASLGLVRAVHGSGTRVAEVDSRPVTAGFQRLLTRGDFHPEDLSAVRLALEVAIARGAAERRTGAHLGRLEKTQRILANPRRSLAVHVKADFEFHATLAAATGNPLFQVVLAPIQELLIGSRWETLGRFGVEIPLQHHARILAAVTARQPEEAAAAMREHLQTNVRHLDEIARRTGEADAPPA